LNKRAIAAAHGGDGSCLITRGAEQGAGQRSRVIHGIVRATALIPESKRCLGLATICHDFSFFTV